MTLLFTVVSAPLGAQTERLGLERQQREEAFELRIRHWQARGRTDPADLGRLRVEQARERRYQRARHQRQARRLRSSGTVTHGTRQGRD